MFCSVLSVSVYAFYSLLYDILLFMGSLTIKIII